MKNTQLLPSTQFDSLIKPLLIHGRLHQLSLQIMEQIKNMQQPLTILRVLCVH